MKKNYTLFISNFFLGFSLFFVWMPQFLSAQNTVVTPPSPLNLCVGGGYSSLGNITIQEDTPPISIDAFASNPAAVTYVITCPANFEFDTSLPAPAVTPISGSGITGASIVVTDAQTLTVTYTLLNSLLQYDGFVVSGVRIRAIGSSAAINLLRTGGTAIQAGNAVINALPHGTVTGFATPSSPVITQIPSGTLCQGSSATFSVTSTGATVYDFLINGVLQQSGASSSFTTNILPAGSPTVTVRAYSSVLCTPSINSINPTVNPIPVTPTVTISGSVGTPDICQGAGNQVILTSSAATGNEWFKNGITTGITTQSITLTTAAESGNYYVRTTVGGCVSNPSTTTTVNIVNLQAYTVSASNNGNYCNAGGTGATISVSNSQSGVTYNLINVSLGTIVQSFVSTGGAFSFATPVTVASGTSVNFKVTAVTTVPSCSLDMSNQITVSNIASPTTQTVSITGGTLSGGTYYYCESAGGVTLGLANSEASATHPINYTLVKGGTDLITVTRSSAGAFNFSGVYTQGSYQIRAVSATTPSCPAGGVTFGTTNIDFIPATAPALSSSGTSSCTTPITLTATPPVSPLAFTSYLWYRNGVLVSTTATNTYTASVTGFYQVEVATASPTCTTSRSSGINITINPSPNLTLAVTAQNSSICQGASTNILISNSEIGVTYQLYDGVTIVTGSVTGGDGGQISLSTGIPAAGSHNYRIEATATGCSPVFLTNTASVTVNTYPSFTISGGTTVCQSTGNITLTINPVSIPVGSTYQWIKNGTDIPAETNTTLVLSRNIPSNTGNYQVRVTGPASSLCSTTSSVQTVTINPAPNDIPVTTTTASVCTGSSAFIQVGNTTPNPSQPGITYQLIDNGTPVAGNILGGNGGQITFTVNNPAIGTHTYTVSATTASGCSITLSGSAVVVVNSFPDPSFSVSGGTTICQGSGNITLTAATTGATYQWLKNGINAPGVSNLQNYTVFGSSSSNSGAYSVIVTLNGCSATSGNQTITINPLPNAITVTLATSTICLNTSATVQIVNSQTNVNYQLFDGTSLVGSIVAGNGSQITLTTPVFTSSGTFSNYSVRAVHSAGNCPNTTNTSVPTITVNPVPVQPTISVLNNPLCTGTGGQVTLTSSTASAYQWYFNNQPVPAGQGGTAVSLNRTLSSQTGSYAVQTFDANGCPSPLSASVNITIIDPPTQLYTLIGTNGGLYCSSDAGARLTLSGSESSSVNYRLYLNGNPTSTIIAGTGGVLDFGIQPSGTYTVRAFANAIANCPSSGLLMTGSVVVQPRPAIAALIVTTNNGSNTFCPSETGVIIRVGSSSNPTNPSLQYRLVYLSTNTTVSTQTGNGTFIDFPPQTTTGNYVVEAEYPTSPQCTLRMTGTINVQSTPLPSSAFVVSVANNGNYCSGDAGARITLSGSQTNVDYQLVQTSPSSLVVTTIAGTGSGLDFGLQPTGTYQIRAYSVSTPACPTGGILVGSPVTVNSPLTINTYTLSAVVSNSYCQGGSGITMRLSGSDGSNVRYRLIRLIDNTVVDSTLGVNGVINFNPQTVASGYIVQAVRGTGTPTCLKTMNGLVTVVITPSPAVFNVTADTPNSYCAGTGGVNVRLSGSQTGVDYQLIQNGSTLITTLTGTGSALDFGLQPQGSYTVVANSISNPVCTTNMSGTAIVNPPIVVNVYTVTGGGSYCIGGSGVPVGLSNSQSNTTYELYRNGVFVSQIVVVSGGSPLSFGNQPAGSYTVKAKSNTTPVCQADMSGSVNIIQNPLPALSFNLANRYCVDAGIIDLTALAFPAGGTFSGPGVSGSQFNPATVTGALPQNITIIYSYTDANGCSNSISKITTVNPLPGVSFTLNPTGPDYFINQSAVNLIPQSGHTSNFTFSGNGIVKINATTYQFVPGQVGLGSYTITYTYTDPSTGCPNSTSQVVNVIPAPSVNFTISKTDFCSNESPVVLQGSAIAGPSGPIYGVFSGSPNISATNSNGQATFNPSGLTGVVTITYTITDQFGNDQIAQKNVTISPAPVVNIDGLKTRYCIYENPDTLIAVVNIPGGNVIFSGPGVQFVNNKYIFSPQAAGASSASSPHRIKLVYTTAQGCTDSTSKAVIVDPLPIVTFSIPATEYCADASDITLTNLATPAGGVFSGAGIISNSIFRPSLAGVGLHTLTYTYTDANGCFNTVNQSVRIRAIPKASFLADRNCNTGTVSFKDISTIDQASGDTIRTWQWNFGDGSISTLQNPSHVFPGPGNYNVSLRVITNKSCSKDTLVSISIGTIPVPEFDWTNICGPDTTQTPVPSGAVTRFTDKSGFVSGNASGKIVTWVWNFGDPGSSGNILTITDTVTQKPTHIFSRRGVFFVKLKVIAESGCEAEITHRVYILPIVTVTPSRTYKETFDDPNRQNGGWIADDKARSLSKNWSWAWGKPTSGKTYLKAAYSGTNAWVTDLSKPYSTKNEKSYVYSPCFNLQAMKRPLLSVKIFQSLEKGYDGVVLQADTVGDGKNWIKVGAINLGLQNWYNESGITSNPGDQNFQEKGEGWSEASNVWKDARYGLDEFKKYAAVRFRFAFSTNADQRDTLLDGFAFDDVEIGERNHIVLLEHFTNYNSPESLQQNTFVNNLSPTNEEVIAIQYQTNFPNTQNPLYQAAPNDISARALYYKIRTAPLTVVDGYNSDTVLSQNPAGVARRKLETPSFVLNIDFPVANPGYLAVKASVTATRQFSDPLVLYIAVVEKDVNGYRNVLRQMLPNAAGNSIIKSWQAGDVTEVTQNMIVRQSTISNLNQLAVIVFIQNAVTKEVYQSIFAQPSVVPSYITATEPAISVGEFAIYPNPANDLAYIVFNEPVSEKHTWTIIDMLGHTIKTGIIYPGEKQVAVPTNSLPDGNYILQIRRRNIASKNGKLLVIH
jgi:hypothetical protein